MIVGLRAPLAALVVAALVSCRGEGPEPARPAAAVPGPVVGRDPIPEVHRAENNSDALVRWALAGVGDRIVVHVDGHIDLDWLPDQTVEAIRAAATEDALRSLEGHPYDLDAPAHGTFAIWSYLYPAARTGRIRELWWVVPDGSLTRPGGFEHLRRFLGDHLSGVVPEEILGLQLAGGVASGTLLGLPVRIAEIAGLPSFSEPVLLDLDADYFGTADAAVQNLRPLPARPVASVMAMLAAKGLRADLATVSSSALGGYLPIRSRIDADEAELWLRDPAEARRREEEIGPRLGAARQALELLDHAGAATMLADLRSVRPEDPALAFLLSEALAGTGDAQGARRALDAAVRADPAYAHATLYKADALRLQGRYDEALALYRQAAGTAPPEWRGYVARRFGTCLLDLGRLPEAEQALRQVVEEHPGHADSWSNLARCLIDQGRREESLPLVVEACRRDPWNGNHLRLLAAVLTRQNRPADSIEPARAAARLRPADVEILKNLGLSLAATGRLAEGRPYLETAVRLHPDDVDALVILGRIALRSGDSPGAVAAFRRALEIDPNHAVAIAGLAEAGG